MKNKILTLIISIFFILNFPLLCTATASASHTSQNVTYSDNVTPVNDTITNDTPISSQTITVSPGESIQKTVDKANPGDTIIVNKGQYSEEVNITTPKLTLKSNHAEIKGLTIKGSGTKIYGFYVHGDGVGIAENTVDCTIRNCIVNNTQHGFYDCIRLSGAGNATIRNNTILNGNNGIVLGKSAGNTVLNNLIYNCNIGIGSYDAGSDIIEGNTIRYSNEGLHFEVTSPHNIIDRNVIKLNKVGISTVDRDALSNSSIYNNYFNNTENLKLDSNLINMTWNVKKTKQTNIVKGKYIGGNYWSNFSETAPDKDGNGIADVPYTISKGNIDNYPLVHPKDTASFDDDIVPVTPKCPDVNDSEPSHEYEDQNNVKPDSKKSYKSDSIDSDKNDFSLNINAQNGTSTFNLTVSDTSKVVSHIKNFISKHENELVHIFREFLKMFEN